MSYDNEQFIPSRMTADPAPAQCCDGTSQELSRGGVPRETPDAALSEAEKSYAQIDPTTYWRGRWYSEASVERILAARAAQPVPAPEVSRGVAEVKAEALREAASEWKRIGWSPAAVEWLRDRADRIVRDALGGEGGGDQ